jgi:hypothetical protein
VNHDGKTVVTSRGESYSINCPFCGDTKHRLSISYAWLERPPLSTRRRTELAHCYNENCEEVREEDFYSSIIEDIEDLKLGSLMETYVEPKPVEPKPLCLPPIEELTSIPEAVEFISKQYPGLKPDYLAKAYGVGFSKYNWDIYSTENRLIFPIYEDDKLLGWQGRTIVNALPRWYIPSGWIKNVYNLYRIPPDDIPIICEGIPSAISCGPKAVALYGSSIAPYQLSRLKAYKKVILALDADTYVPDNRKGGKGKIKVMEVKAQLIEAGITPLLIQWPDEVLALATKANNSINVKVPDAADLGPRIMKGIIDYAQK